MASMTTKEVFVMKALFIDKEHRFDGIPPLNIYAMRLIYVLMFLVLGKDCVSHILYHEGAWEPLDAMSWSVWTAFAALGLPGIFHTVRMVPVLLLEVAYKLLWLALVAYPLWRDGTLAGSSAEGMAAGFAWVALPIVAIPWPYVMRTFVLGRKPVTV
jgi:hypothetical protein